MDLAAFRKLVARLTEEIPQQFREGIAAIAVSPATVRHPERPAAFTLGECISLPGDPGPGSVDQQSRIMLYHGSFAALAAEEADFDWESEAWETLTHELRHHLEWKADEGALEALDEAVEENFARHEGGGFDPGFFRDGNLLEPGCWEVEGDVFLEQAVRGGESESNIAWRGRNYRIPHPADMSLPAFLVVEGVADGPEGELVLVLFDRVRGLIGGARPYEDWVRAEQLD